MRFRWLPLLALLLVAGVTLVAWPRGSGNESVPAVARPGASPASAVPPSTPAPPPALARATAQPTFAQQSASSVSSPLPAPTVDEGYPVNLERLRAEIPRNRYWADGVPTDDPEVLKRREGEAAAWNQLHGRILSGTASDSEIRAWIDHRRQVSEDAIEFAQRVLAEHGSELPDRDRGLLELAISMHHTRLEELPRREAEARARKEEQDRRRAAWNGGPPP